MWICSCLVRQERNKMQMLNKLKALGSGTEDGEKTIESIKSPLSLGPAKAVNTSGSTCPAN